LSETVYRANRLLVGFWVLLFFAFGAALFWPPVANRIREGGLGSVFALVNGLTPDQRMAVFYVLAALLAVAGVAMARFLFDNRIMRMDDQGITVRHPFRTHSASWIDFIEVKMVGFGNSKQPRLHFGDGPSPEGGPNTRKLSLPTPIFGLNLKAVIVDVMVRVALARGRSRFAGRRRDAT
jgi:hypothetical protein